MTSQPNHSTIADATKNPQLGEMTFDELNEVSGGGITLVADKNYVGLEISVGGYGVAVWATGGSVCGSVSTPKSPGSGHCTP